MKGITIDVSNYERNLKTTDFDVLVVEKLEHLYNVATCSLVTITITEGQRTLRIKYWKEDNGIETLDFLYIPETETLFFKSQNQWGAIDTENRILKRHENSTWKPSIERKTDYILIEDDLKAESTTLNGDKIDSVPIDPPTELKEFDDRIEYNSPIFGRQVLKIK